MAPPDTVTFSLGLVLGQDFVAWGETVSGIRSQSVEVVIMSDKSLGYKGRGVAGSCPEAETNWMGLWCWAETGAWVYGHGEAHGLFDRDLMDIP